LLAAPFRETKEKVKLRMHDLFQVNYLYVNIISPRKKSHEKLMDSKWKTQILGSINAVKTIYSQEIHFSRNQNGRKNLPGM
jgi:hypothetical protein